MKSTKNNSSKYFTSADTVITDTDTQELKNLAEKLEQELGHEYFSKPLDYNKDKKENKPAELLELEKEISNLGKIVLPQANLQTQKELSPLDQENIPLLIPQETSHASFKLSKDEYLKNWQKPWQEKKAAQENLVKENPENFWDIVKKEKEAKEAEKSLRAQKQAAKETEKKLLAEEKAAAKLIKKQEREKKYQAWLEQKQEKHWQKIATKAARQQEKNSYRLAKNTEKKEQPNFAWLLTYLKKPILYLVGIELFFYLLSSAPLFQNFILNTVLDYLIIIDLFVFVWLTLFFKKQLGQNSSATIKAVIITGLLVGFFRALFKIFWLGENWTLVNIVVEPLISGLYGLIISVIFSLIIRKNNKPLLKNI